ncbi:MAG: homocysteine S-methyltransferase family protein [Oscillospiraceae bacterium]|nr:homocysteine S-methyltransferase family protein [Oscillospiraceae bacterium]MBQ3049697.1 homocysteine S-methyltransferase family protein [Oscillospiraceae bacterium]
MENKFNRPLLLDGATGTNLIAAGMPSGICVESWILENPEVLIELQKSFIRAGSDIIYAPTFSANAAKLRHYGLENDVEDLNARLVELSREAASTKSGTMVAGDLSPTGLIMEPYGDTSFMEIMDIYSQQALALRDAGVDLIVCETMISLNEIRAALLGAKQSGLPVFVTMTINEHGKTLFGSDALSSMIILQAMGASAFGFNCSGGPDTMLPFLEKVTPLAKVPIIAKPNAGKPHPDDATKFDLTPEHMAESMKKALDMGVSIIGGCCGTTPDHIAALRKLLDSYDFSAVNTDRDLSQLDTIAANEREVFYLEEDFDLSETILCTEDMADDIMDAEDEGFDVISVRVDSYDDALLLSQNAHMANLPFSIISDSEEALEFALILCAGRNIIDSRCGIEPDTLKKLADWYGALIF